MEFMRESWAGMNNNDKLNEANTIANQQFQQVVPRKKKNQHKPQAEAKKENYATRLRVGAPKGLRLKI